jgi:hypothetical protein
MFMFRSGGDFNLPDPCAVRSSKISPTSGVWDPDPHGSALILVGWMRRIQVGKNDPQKFKKGRNFKF